MGVSVSDYKTSKFTLKNQEAVDYIKRLVDLLQDEDNHSAVLQIEALTGTAKLREDLN